MEKYTDNYNIAFSYLGNKYGLVRIGYSSYYYKKIKQAKTKKEYSFINNNLTDLDFVLTINKDKDMESDDKLIYLLLNQYYYGMEAKKELFNILTNLRLLKN